MHSDPSRRTRLPGRHRGQGQAELSEFLVAAAVRAAVRISRDKLPPALVLPGRVAWLVHETMRTLAAHPGKLFVILALAAAVRGS